MSSPRRLASYELEDLHGHRLAELIALAVRTMNRLGVPRQLRGIEETGPQAINTTGEAFTFETAQGGRNTRPGRHPQLEELGALRVRRGGIDVDGAVLDDNFLPFESWRQATVEQRMEAVIAHEFAEYHSPGTHFSWRHADAIMRSSRNQHISPEARAIIADQLRAALAGQDAQIIPPLADRIQEVLREVAQRAALS
jgi:hypothetical protein